MHPLVSPAKIYLYQQTLHTCIWWYEVSPFGCIKLSTLHNLLAEKLIFWCKLPYRMNNWRSLPATMELMTGSRSQIISLTEQMFSVYTDGRRSWTQNSLKVPGQRRYGVNFSCKNYYVGHICGCICQSAQADMVLLFLWVDNEEYMNLQRNMVFALNQPVVQFNACVISRGRFKLR